MSTYKQYQYLHISLSLERESKSTSNGIPMYQISYYIKKIENISFSFTTTGTGTFFKISVSMFSLKSRSIRCTCSLSPLTTSNSSTTRPYYDYEQHSTGNLLLQFLNNNLPWDFWRKYIIFVRFVFYNKQQFCQIKQK